MKKLSIKRKRQQSTPPSRITNETVAEHRERVIAGGRKFKYPVQYARHKLVINAIIIAVASILIIIGGIWIALYPMKNSGSMTYRITRVIPLPVGAVNGEIVLYSDYLASYRASEYYLNKNNEIKQNTDDGKVQLDYYRRQSLNLAERIAYARQLAREHNITVSAKDIDEFIEQERVTANGRVSQETYDASIRMVFGENSDDYRFRTSGAMLESKVAFAIDSDAKAQSQRAAKMLSDGKAMPEVVESVNKLSGGKATAGVSGRVDVTGKFNGLRMSEVSKLEKGALSGVLQTTTDDGYYIVRLTEKTSTKIAFEYIHIPLSTFKKQFEQLKKDGKVAEYISVPEVQTQQ